MRIIIWGSRKMNRIKAKEIIENKIEELKPEDLKLIKEKMEKIKKKMED